jgi:hypothetical protein
MKLTGENRSTRGKICHSATLTTTNPTCTDSGSNPGLRDGSPATNRLSHGTAMSTTLHCSASAGKITLLYGTHDLQVLIRCKFVFDLSTE